MAQLHLQCNSVSIISCQNYKRFCWNYKRIQVLLCKFKVQIHKDFAILSSTSFSHAHTAHQYMQDTYRQVYRACTNIWGEYKSRLFKYVFLSSADSFQFSARVELYSYDLCIVDLSRPNHRMHIMHTMHTMHIVHIMHIVLLWPKPQTSRPCLIAF